MPKAKIWNGTAWIEMDAKNADTATKLATSRTISLAGDVTGSASFDGSANVSITATIADDSHNHIISNIDGLQTALDGKASNSHTHSITDVTGLQAALDGKSASSHNHNLDNLSNVTISSKLAGQFLEWNGTAWINNSLVATDIPSLDTSKITTGTMSASRLPVASTSAQGIVQLSAAVNSTSATLAATASAVKSAYDLANAAVAKSGGTMTGFLTLNANPTGNMHAVTKQYVDSVVSGLDVKKSVKAATTGNITLSGTQTIDGVTLVAGDRVLVKNQNVPTENGIYVVATGAWTRSTGTDSNTELTPGAFTFVEQGTANSDTGWILSTDGTITIGTTAITWTQFSSAGVIGVDATLSKSGNTIGLQSGIVIPGTYVKTTVDTYGRTTGGSALVASDIPNLDWSKITSGKPTTLSGYGITDALGISANAVSASKLQTARTISLTGDVTGSVSFDGSGNVSLTAVVVDDSHDHIISNVDGLQTALDGKLSGDVNSEQVVSGAEYRVQSTTNAAKFTIEFNETEGSLDFVYSAS